MFHIFTRYWNIGVLQSKLLSPKIYPLYSIFNINFSGLCFILCRLFFEICSVNHFQKSRLFDDPHLGHSPPNSIPDLHRIKFILEEITPANTFHLVHLVYEVSDYSVYLCCSFYQLSSA